MRKNPDSLVYNCLNKELGVVGKIIVLKDKSECKAFPKKMSTDMKNLTNKK